MDITQSFKAKVGLAHMLEGGVIMDVTTPEQASIAAQSGAQAVMALERIPADIRAHGGVVRMSSPDLIKRIQDAVTIPVMAKCRIGHMAEADILESLQVDFIDESEVLTPADDQFHINKHNYTVPFVCGCRSLGEALRRINEGAALIRTKGEAGTGDIVEAVRHLRLVSQQLQEILDSAERAEQQFADKYRVPLQLIKQIKEFGQMPVPMFSAGGVATPADAALMMKLGAQAVFVGSGVFKSQNPQKVAESIVEAVAHYDDPKLLAQVSGGLGQAMSGVSVASLPDDERLAPRGW